MVLHQVYLNKKYQNIKEKLIKNFLKNDNIPQSRSIIIKKKNNKDRVIQITNCYEKIIEKAILPLIDGNKYVKDN